MPGVPVTSLEDVVDHSLPAYVDRGTFETALESQDYPMMEMFFADGVRKGVPNGNGLEWRVIYRKSQAARYIRPFEVTPDNYIEVFANGSASWRHIETKALYNEIVARDMGGEQALVDYMDGEMFVAVEAAIELLENSVWEIPNSNTDDRAALGIPYWLPIIASGSVSEGGFTGDTVTFSGGGGTSTIIGGIDRSVEPYARSYQASHPGEVNLIYLRRLRRAMQFTGFKTPQGLRQFIKMQSNPNELVYFTGQDDRLAYEELVNLGPDDRNGDMNPFRDEAITFRGMRWVATPQLDGAARMPGYGVRRRWVYPVSNSQLWGRRDRPERLDDRFTVRVAWDWRFQTICTNPRKAGFSMATST